MQELYGLAYAFAHPAEKENKVDVCMGKMQVPILQIGSLVQKGCSKTPS